MFSILQGAIIHYVILRDGQERYRGDENSFTDVGGIRPFQEYNYQLRVCNYAGCTDSTQVSIQDLHMVMLVLKLYFSVLKLNFKMVLAFKANAQKWAGMSSFYKAFILW